MYDILENWDSELQDLDNKNERHLLDAYQQQLVDDLLQPENYRIYEHAAELVAAVEQPSNELIQALLYRLQDQGSTWRAVELCVKAIPRLITKVTDDDLRTQMRLALQNLVPALPPNIQQLTFKALQEIHLVL